MFSLAFLRNNGRELGFGFAMCFLSSFGQTFFISLFGGQIRAEFAITDGEFGVIYSTGTIASAALLLWSGQLVDRFRLATMAGAVLAGLAVVCVMMGFAWGPVMLALAIFGLRQFGQGLSSHTAVTAMARRFAAERGRALSVAALGFTAGEGLLPAAVVFGLGYFHWRSIWFLVAVVLMLSIPLARRLARPRQQTAPIQPAPDRPAPGTTLAQRVVTGQDHTMSAMLREPSLWFRLPSILASSFISTGLFVHQVTLASAKGWPMTFWASIYIVLAIFGLVAVVVSGPMVDRYSARRILPFYLIPLAMASTALWLSSSPLAAVAFMIFMGLNAGLSQITLGAIWAELFGIAHLGAIRAFATAAMVFSTGLAPAIMGIAIDWGSSIETIALGCGLFCIVASGLAAVAPAPLREASERIL